MDFLPYGKGLLTKETELPYKETVIHLINLSWASLVAQRVKCLPATQETRVRSLGREDPLEKEMATHSGILAWRTPRTDKAGGLQSMGLQRIRHN